MTAAAPTTVVELWDADERAAWRPPPRLKPSEWAERYRYLPRGQSSIEGPWRNDSAPHLRAISDLPLAPGVVQLNIRKPAQVGGSEALRNLIGYLADCEPDPIGLTLPGQEKGRQIVENRLLPLFRNTPHLQRLLPAQAHDLKKGQIKLANGFILHLMWSGSASSTASDPMRIVVNDEVDKFAEWSGREADAVTLTEKRLRTFADRRCQINLSTPTTRFGRITSLVEASDVLLHFHVPCPLCGTYQRLVFPRLRWRKFTKKEAADKFEAASLLLQTPGAVWYECAQCRQRIDESHKVTMARAGRWVSDDGQVEDAEAVRAWPPGTRIAVQIDPLYVRWIRWADVAAEFVRAEGDLARTMDFQTQTLGQPFELQVARTDTDFFRAKCARAALAEAVVPVWAAKILVTIDTQHDHFWVVVRAWGPDMRSARVWHGRVDTFEELDGLCFRQTWPVEDPAFPPMMAELVLIDSGGTRLEGDRASRTMQVYQWVLPRQSRVRALKGANQPRQGVYLWRGKGWLDADGRRDAAAARRHVPLVFIDTQHFADVLAELQHRGTTPEDERPETWHLNQRDDPEYNQHLAGVAKVVLRRGAVMREEWRPKQDGTRIDLWDCEVYQCAAAYLAHVHLLPPLEQFLELREAERREVRRREAARRSGGGDERHDPWNPRPL